MPLLTVGQDTPGLLWKRREQRCRLGSFGGSSSLVSAVGVDLDLLPGVNIKADERAIEDFGRLRKVGSLRIISQWDDHHRSLLGCF